MKKIWEWLTLKRTAEILNIGLSMLVVIASVAWVDELGSTFTETKTIGGLIDTNLILATFWLGGCMLGMTLPKDKE